MIEKDIISNTSYTNKDFQSIFPELLELAKKLTDKWDPTQSNESDPGVVLIKLLAIIADKLNYNIDKNILECFPASVTQESNARNLFDQLGYSMNWFISATTDSIYMQWLGDTDSNKQIEIPLFTQITNKEGNIVYTVLNPTGDAESNRIPQDGTIISFNAIQGSWEDLTINTPNDSNSNKRITLSNIDENNRIYFPISTVAENGIFICSYDDTTTFTLDNLTEWKKVDNLAVEPLGQKCYKFGVSNKNNFCYIEFPEDISSLIGNGIRIRYIRSDGYNGNVNYNNLIKFYESSEFNVYTKNINTNEYELSEETVSLTDDNFSIRNVVSILNGLDPENIDSAYKNYQKTIGIFNTLVTLRDYTNRINVVGKENNLVSNAIVSDRTNDIQETYSIISSNKNNVENIEHETELTAFDLKMYLLTYESNVNNRIVSDNTFIPIKRTETTNDVYNKIIALINDDKCIQHDFKFYKNDEILFFKNKYAINCNIVPNYKLSTKQIAEIQTNIESIIYSNLNAKEVDFGEEILYDYLYDLILNSDERIKSISLEPLKYYTYAVYFDEATDNFKEILINDIIDDSQYVRVYLTFDSNNKPKFSTLPGGTNYLTTNDLNGKYAFIAIAPGQSMQPQALPYIHKILKDLSYDTNTDNEIIFTVYSDKYDKFREIIYAKSVLAGNTQFFVRDNSIDYSLSQLYKFDIKNVKYVNTNADIVCENDTEVELHDNENVVFIKPNYISKTQYGLGVRYEYNLENQVDVNSTYTLQGDNEFIIFYWKTVDDDSAPYNYYKYTKDSEFNIIKPSFTLRAGQNYIDGGVGTDLNAGSGVITNPTQISRIKSATQTTYNLSVSQNINIVAPNIIDTENNITYSYWVTKNNANESNKYKLTLTKNNTDDEYYYFLQNDEYFINMDNNLQNMQIYGSGTKIYYNAQNDSNDEYKTYSVDAIKLEDIFSKGVKAFDKQNLFVSSKLEDNDGYWKFAEMSITTLGPGVKLKLSNINTSITINNTLQTLNAGIDIQYQHKDESSWIKLESSTSGYQVMSLLHLNCDKLHPQQIEHNHTIEFTFIDEALLSGTYKKAKLYYEDTDDDTDLTHYKLDLIPLDESDDDELKPISMYKDNTKLQMLSSYMLRLQGSTEIDVSSFDDNLNVIYPQFYFYEQSPFSIVDDVNITLPQTEPGIPISLPNGNYIISESHYDDDTFVFNKRFIGNIGNIYDYSSFKCPLINTIKGDVNNDGYVTEDDANYLLFNTLYPDTYPINQYCDFDGNGQVDSADANYLLFNTFYPNDYPISNVGKQFISFYLPDKFLGSYDNNHVPAGENKDIYFNTDNKKYYQYNTSSTPQWGEFDAGDGKKLLSKNNIFVIKIKNDGNYEYRLICSFPQITSNQETFPDDTIYYIKIDDNTVKYYKRINETMFEEVSEPTTSTDETPQGIETPLPTINNIEITGNGKYYHVYNSDIPKDSISQNTIGEVKNWLVIRGTAGKTVNLSNVYKYDEITNGDTTETKVNVTNVKSKLFELDKNHKYNYLHTVRDEIVYPLDSSSFFNTHFIYNKYIICQPTRVNTEYINPLR